VSVAILASLNISQIPATSTAPPAEFAEDTFPEVQRVSLADAKTAFDTKTAIFVDVRDADSYADSHIPRALSIPLAELNERLDELNRSDWIITYCT
jgi:3-mercaptopyruvate sulfurtransferase SseA